ncbi:MAG TPA: 6-phosphogluconolactonase [Gaiellaceae bacterium]|jgi:6-phosphogluconolactonase|nr:6-phosphogluconolactonase [Gaiellaceae bacterium]
MSLYGVELVVADNLEQAASILADTLVEAARAGRAMALTGGHSPGRAYQLAAERQPDWSGASVWWGDERCVPPDDERSNYRLARENLLDRLEAQPAETHRIRGELGADAAADEYDALLKDVRLDLVLLGVGPDGHTASLFSNTPALEERERRAVATEAKLEPFVDRVTMTIPMLASAAEVVFILTGADKADAAERAFGRAPDPATPASLVRSSAGTTRVVADHAAAARLLH